MKGHVVKLTLPDSVYDGIVDTERRTGRSLAEVAGEMLAEAVKMRRVPGIVFADGVHGRVARIAGTGAHEELEVGQLEEHVVDAGGGHVVARARQHDVGSKRPRAPCQTLIDGHFVHDVEVWHFPDKSIDQIYDELRTSEQQADAMHRRRVLSKRRTQSRAGLDGEK